MATTCVAGVADKANTGTAFTVSVTFMVCVMFPPIPVITRGYVPAAADGLTVNVRSEEPAPPGIGFTLKVAVTPAGSPETLNDTSLVNPLIGEVEIVYLSLDPVLMAKELGAAHKEKSDAVGPLTNENINVP